MVTIGGCDESVGGSEQVVGQDVEVEPCGVRGELSGGVVVESEAVFEVSDGGFDDGTVVVASPQRFGVAGLVGDERVVVDEVEEP